MISKLLAGTAITFVAATGVAAQDIEYGQVNLSYSNYDFDGGNIDLLTAGAEVGFAVGAADYWISAGRSQIEAGDGAPGITLSYTSFGAGYEFQPGLRADVSYNEFSGSASIIGLSTEFIEAGIGYQSGAFYGRASYSALLDDEIGAEALFGILAGYEVSPNTDVALSLHFVDDDFDSVDNPLIILSASHDGGAYRVEGDLASFSQDGVDAYLVTISGEYDITPDYLLRGAYSRADLDGDGIDRISIGAGYRLSEQAVAFADLTSLSAEGEDAFGVTLGVSYDFGDKPTVRSTTTDRIMGIAEDLNAASF